MADGFEVDPSLYELARGWDVYTAVTMRFKADHDVLIARCRECHEEILSTGEAAAPTDVDVIRHLMNSHGYRMDGRQFDNRNNEVGHA